MLEIQNYSFFLFQSSCAFVSLRGFREVVMGIKFHKESARENAIIYSSEE